MPTSALREGRLNRQFKEPLWQQLVAVLREAIETGALLPDQALPSEADLVDRFGVSRTVVREALAEMVRNGSIYKIRAKGSFVAPPPRDLSFIGSNVGSFQDLARSGRSVSTHVLTLDEGQADDREAAALRIPAGTKVVRMRRLRTVDGTPWMLVRTTLPRDRFGGLHKANLEDRSLYDHLRRTYGVEAVGADRWLQAVVLSPEDAGLLQLAPGSPVLDIESVAWDKDEVPFEYYRALHRTDESRFYVGVR